MSPNESRPINFMIKYLIIFALCAGGIAAADAPPARKRVIGMSQ